MGAVVLGENVFVGDAVRILKGASIGAHSVIGAGSVVTGQIPECVIAAGNPARVIREIEDAREPGGVPPGSATSAHMDAGARFSSQ